MVVATYSGNSSKIQDTLSVLVLAATRTFCCRAGGGGKVIESESCTVEAALGLELTQD